jgi:hypothetical protein
VRPKKKKECKANPWEGAKLGNAKQKYAILSVQRGGQASTQFSLLGYM